MEGFLLFVVLAGVALLAVRAIGKKKFKDAAHHLTISVNMVSAQRKKTGQLYPSNRFVLGYVFGALEAATQAAAIPKNDQGAELIMGALSAMLGGQATADAFRRELSRVTSEGVADPSYLQGFKRAMGDFAEVSLGKAANGLIEGA